jgi:gliding motility-associated-like protein
MQRTLHYCNLIFRILARSVHRLYNLKILLKSIAVVLLLILAFCADASHYRAGEITYRQLSGRLFRITATTYTDPQSAANQYTNVLTIVWGDGTETVVDRTQKDVISSNVQRNVYEFNHEYQSDGVFLISLSDPNRVANIVNINGGTSDNTPFYVESLIRVSGVLGNNQSPIMTVPPIVDGCLDFLYMHNPGAYDPDGDSLVYTLTTPKQATGVDVPNYEDPRASDSVRLNPHTGTLYWANPIGAGLYNIAIRISEYRNGLLVGYVVRDMQIRIRDCVNAPPLIADMPNTCVNAGDSVQFDISATDINIQLVTIRGYGAPFEVPVSKAVITPNPGQGMANATTRFLWKTDCRHIRYRPYQGTIEAIDNFSIPMASYKTFDVKVVGPAPRNVTATQVRSGFRIAWQRDSCQLANKYNIYRRIDSSYWTPTHCRTGLPDSLGFTLIGTIQAQKFESTDTSFYDDNKGEGLSPLVNYCYRVVAIFPARNANGDQIFSEASESYASAEICDAIIRSKPVITHVSVTTTDLVNGALRLAWLRPDTLDTVNYTAPYQLVFKRAVGTGAFTTFRTISYPTFSSIRDSAIIDTNINTRGQQFTYRIELMYDSAGTPTFVDVSPAASSVFTTIYSTDNTNILSWNEKVPWDNHYYTVFRRNDVTGEFDSLTTTASRIYRDTGLLNNHEYCYLVTAFGSYSFYDSVLVNNSQRICGTPVDTVRPCPPALTVTPPCNVFNDFTNKLSWTQDMSCGNDVISYNIYYKKLISDSYMKIGTVSNTTYTFDDIREILKLSIAGCYAVAGVDSFNNESHLFNEVCIDNCPYYEIPNVFSPNGDGKNDQLHPFPYRFIDHISLKIYNRWGQVVFQTDDLDINWDGKDKDSGRDCSEGVYFYTCDVYEQYLEMLKNSQRRGTIHIIR